MRGRDMPGGFAVTAASPYTMLATKGRGDGRRLNAELPLLDAPIGPWLLAEARQQLETLKLEHPKARDLERNLIIGLVFTGQPHVVPAWDPEVEALVNPKYLIDGLGRWPAAVRWTPNGGQLVIDTGETRYWIAPIVRPTLAL